MKNNTNEFGDVLDAYGHLQWTVSMRPSKDGGDWLACFDARRVSNGIEYHVVVNSDSGGFIDTVEHKTIPIKNAKELFYLVEYYNSLGEEVAGKMYSCKKVAASWRRLIKSLVKEEEPEVHKYETPQEMGWVGKDGRP